MKSACVKCAPAGKLMHFNSLGVIIWEREAYPACYYYFMFSGNIE